MVLGIECSGHESTSASGMVTNHSKKLTNTDETKIGNNGNSIPESGHNQYEALEVLSSPPLVVAEASSPSPSPPTIKGTGLKKWKRMRRDVSLEGGCNLDNSKLLKRGLANSATNLNKPVKFSAEQTQASEGSASSSNAVWKNFSPSAEHFGGNTYSGLVVGPILAAGTDSENSEDHSSKSTAASAPKKRHEVREMNKMMSVSGKKLATSLPIGHQGKPRTDTSKKQKGEQVKIEKENSHSSLESDSRTSHVVYGQGNYSATSNGRQSEKSMISGEETSDEAHGIEQELSEEPQADSSRKNGEFEFTSAEKSGVDCPWAAKDDKSEYNGSPRNLDPLVESIFVLQSVQQELEKEVEKYREIGKEDNIQEEYDDVLGLDVVKLKGDREDMEIEVERVFKEKIEAEVEFLGITKTVEKMRVGGVWQQNNMLEEEKKKQMKMVEEVGKLKGTFYEDIGNNKKESLKLRSSVWKYASCFILQLVLMLAVLFFWQLGGPVDFVPT